MQSGVSPEHREQTASGRRLNEETAVAARDINGLLTQTFTEGGQKLNQTIEL